MSVSKKKQRRLLKRVSFRYLTVERSLVLLDIDFNVENQDDIVRTFKKLSLEESIINSKKFVSEYIKEFIL